MELKNESHPGQIYVKDLNFIFGNNDYLTFLVISSENGAILETLKPYTIEKEKESLIIDGTGEYLGVISFYESMP